MKILNRIRKYFRKRRRNCDRQVLFPFLERRSQGNTDLYQRAVLQHIEVDTAWRFADEWVLRDYEDPFENILRME